ncbi:MAG TPA: hypothetical protein VFW75_08315 [Acetobacteraceae bacterium]|nr:hypothetical protein [Acetobacteraceae bacterium]
MVVRAAGVVGLAGIGIGLFFALSGGYSPPALITTDTPAYCRHLLHRVDNLARFAAGPPHQQAAELALEGQSLCARGEVRGGILRLRRAVKLMTDTAPGAVSATN